MRNRHSLEQHFLSSDHKDTVKGYFGTYDTRLINEISSGFTTFEDVFDIIRNINRGMVSFGMSRSDVQGKVYSVGSHGILTEAPNV